MASFAVLAALVVTSATVDAAAASRAPIPPATPSEPEPAGS
jgi:hypothetical protein